LSGSKLKYLDHPFNNALILAVLLKLHLGQADELSSQEQVVLLALKRANNGLEYQSPEQIGEYLSTMDEEQLAGLANNVKGILHEIEYVSLENSDGDLFEASLFTETNHPGTDVILTNTVTGEINEVQLKATDSKGYVAEWLADHPEGEIVVTDEIAESMDLQSSGFANDELTVRVDDFLDKLVELEEGSMIWSYFPGLPLISIAIAGFHLVRRYHKGEIEPDHFKALFAKMTGFQVGKFALVGILMMIPGVNVLVGAGLLFNLLYQVKTLSTNLLPK